MPNVLLFTVFASLVVCLFEIIAALVFMATNNSVALKVFQALDYTMTVAGLVVMFLWIADIIFGI